MTGRAARLSALMALGLLLQMVENALALPVFLPGAKLGLANLATLVVLGEFGAPAAALFSLVRHLAASLATGSFLTPPFWLGISGSLVASVALLAFGDRRRLQSAGLLSGAAFQAGQGMALQLLTGSAEASAYLPPLLALGVGAGLLTGLLARQIQRALTRDRPLAEPALAWLAAGLLSGALLLALLLPATGRAASPWAGSRGEAGPGLRAVVTLPGQPPLTLPLAQPRQVRLPVEGGQMVLQLREGGLRVLESDCPDQVCVRTGWIVRPGAIIACAPHRVLIQLTGSGLDGLLH